MWNHHSKTNLLLKWPWLWLHCWKHYFVESSLVVVSANICFSNPVVGASLLINLIWYVNTFTHFRITTYTVMGWSPFKPYRAAHNHQSVMSVCLYDLFTDIQNPVILLKFALTVIQWMDSVMDILYLSRLMFLQVQRTWPSGGRHQSVSSRGNTVPWSAPHRQQLRVHTLVHAYARERYSR